MTVKVDLAIVGAGSLAGEALVELMQERDFPVGNLFLLDAEDGVGKKVEYNGKYYSIADVSKFDFSQAALCIFCSTPETAEEYIPQALSAACRVVDGSGYSARDEHVPMLLPGVNDEMLGDISSYPILACPSAISAILWTALKPLYDAAGISQLSVTTFEAVTDLGKEASEDLASQTVSLLNMREVTSECFTKQLAFNVLPQVGELQANGYSDAEQTLMEESHKLLSNEDIVIVPTAVRVPVFFGHSLAVHLETRQTLSLAEVESLLQAGNGTEITDREEKSEYPTAVTDAKDQDLVYIGRVRQHPAQKNCISLWLVADNIRRGAALTLLQVTEILVKGSN